MTNDPYQRSSTPERGGMTEARGRRWPLLITVVTCACLAVAGVLVAVLSSPGGKAGHTTAAKSGPVATRTPMARPLSSGKPGPAPTPSLPSTSAVTRAAISSRALRWPPGHKHLIEHWKAGPGGTALAAVTQQLGNVTQAAGARLYDSMKLSCTNLASAVTRAQAGPPVPDAQMQRLYAKVLLKLYQAANDCQRAISAQSKGDESVEIHLDRPLLDRSAAEFATDGAQLYKATAEIRALRS
jgi:hypothetical protein